MMRCQSANRYQTKWVWDWVNAQADALTYQLDGEVMAHHGDDGELGSMPEISTGHPITKAISHEEIVMTVITFGSSVSAGNAKTRRHERRRKLAIEREAIGSIIDSIFGCSTPEATQEESRKHAGRVERAISAGSIRDKPAQEESAERKNRIWYKQPGERGITCSGRQKVKGKSIPLI